jgi:threonine/homoserine/homoserine lactone efflux protein
MSFELWIAFTLGSAALLAVPGPTVMLVVSYALGHGRSSGWATVPGVTLGDFTAMTISMLGAGAIIAASATLFTILKIIGAGYLIWLGIQLWRAGPVLKDTDRSDKISSQRMFWNAYIVTALNPKSIAFFIAFVPQFLNPAAPVFAQLVLMEATFLALAAANVGVWAILAGQMRLQFKKAMVSKVTNRIGAVFLIVAGLLTAAIRRTN